METKKLEKIQLFDFLIKDLKTKKEIEMNIKRIDLIEDSCNSVIHMQRQLEHYEQLVDIQRKIYSIKLEIGKELLERNEEIVKDIIEVYELKALMKILEIVESDYDDDYEEQKVANIVIVESLWKIQEIKYKYPYNKIELKL